MPTRPLERTSADVSSGYRLTRVCITGPESTGKTTLAARLAADLGTEWVAEASRGYAERKAGALTAADVVPIAREQIALDEHATAQAQARGAHLLVLDTDLLSTAIYARYYYGAVPPFVVREERARRADLYLLCDVDVPWMADGVRDRPNDRTELFGRFRDALRRRGANVTLITGGFDARWAAARRAIEALQK